MKRYIKPEILIAQINNDSVLNTTSPGGVNNGDKVGNSYNSSDVTYSRGRGDWDDED